MKSEWFQKKPLNLSHQSMLLPREIFQNSRKPEMMTFPSLYREYHVTEWALSSSAALTLLSSVLSHSHCQSQAICIYRTLLWSLRKQTTAWCWLPAQPEAVNLPHLHVLLIRSTMRRKSILSLLRIRLSFYIVMTNVLCHSVKSTQIQKAISLHFAPHSARVLTSYCLERCETMRPSIQLSQRLKPVISYFHHFTQLVPQIPLTE